jgi:hypothetical protein
VKIGLIEGSRSGAAKDEGHQFNVGCPAGSRSAAREFLPKPMGWDDDDAKPILIIEDLSGAQRVPCLPSPISK